MLFNLQTMCLYFTAVGKRGSERAGYTAAYSGLQHLLSPQQSPKCPQGAVLRKTRGATCPAHPEPGARCPLPPMRALRTQQPHREHTASPPRRACPHSPPAGRTDPQPPHGAGAGSRRPPPPYPGLGGGRRGTARGHLPPRSLPAPPRLAAPVPCPASPCRAVPCPALPPRAASPRRRARPDLGVQDGHAARLLLVLLQRRRHLGASPPPAACRVLRAPPPRRPARPRRRLRAAEGGERGS